MRYFKIMLDGATLCCIETEMEINFNNINGIIERLDFQENEQIEKIIEVDKDEAYEWYDVINYLNKIDDKQVIAWLKNLLFGI